MTDRIPYAIRPDLGEFHARRKWENASERNLSIAARWMAGVELSLIAAEFGMKSSSAWRIANDMAVPRFRRVDGHRPYQRNRPAFWDNVDKSGGPESCWVWTGARDHDGYGTQRGQRAHRVSLAESIGRALRPGELACHRCDNPPCVNPAHLEVGDAKSNSMDMMARGRHRN